MKKLILLLTFLCLSLAQLAIAGQYSAQSEIRRVEDRLTAYLSKYLDPYDFMVVVTPKKDSADEMSLDEDSEILPGVPGFDLQAEGKGKYSGYYDTDGRLVNSIARPPLGIQVVFSRRVSGESVRALRKIIPQIANVNTEYGDDVKISVANLEKPHSLLPTPQEEGAVQPHTLEVVMKYKKEMIWVGVALVVTLFLLLLLHEIMAYMKVRISSSERPVHRAPAAAAGIAPAPAAESNLAKSEKIAVKQHLPNRDELYSKDTALHGRIQEVVAQAKQHPHRFVMLLTHWLQSGEVGIRSAAILLHNLDMVTTERILERMLASDIDYLQAYMDLEFDPFSEENTRVIMQARQDLMKIVAQTSGKEVENSLGFVQALDQDVLAEMLADESAKTIAYLSHALPAHRLSEVIGKFDEKKQKQFVTELCKFRLISDEEVTAINHRLSEKAMIFKKMIFTEAEKAKTFTNIVKNLKTEQAKLEFLEEIKVQSSAIQQQVRNSVFLFEDVTRLSERALKMLLAEEDAILVARAFSRGSAEQKEKVRSVLSKTNLEIFDYELARQDIFPDKECEEARLSLVNRLSVLVFDKVISRNELQQVSVQRESA